MVWRMNEPPDIPSIEEEEEGCSLCRQAVRIIAICVIAFLLVIGFLSWAEAGIGRRAEPPVPEKLIIGEKVMLPTTQVCRDRERAIELFLLIEQDVHPSVFAEAWKKAYNEGLCGPMRPSLWTIVGIVKTVVRDEHVTARLIHIRLDLADGKTDGFMDFWTFTRIPVVEVTVLHQVSMDMEDALDFLERTRAVERKFRERYTPYILRYKELLGCSLQSKEMRFPTMEACMNAAMAFISLDEVVDAACYHYSVKERGS